MLYNNNFTICIPTYNRKKELRYALESIRETFGDAINVVVTDNASTDGTDRMCHALMERCVFRSFKYYRWETNQGPDRNYLKAIELVNTEYCMLLGSDDAFLSTAKTLLQDVLAEQPDIAIFSRVKYSRDLGRPLKPETFWKNSVKRKYLLSSDDDYDVYIKKCTSLAAFFSYLSVIVFRRDMWVENNNVQKFVGSAYVHVAALLERMRSKKNCLLLIERRPLVKCRTGNDSFLQDGHLKRFTIDWDGYEKLAKKYFPSRTRVLTQLLVHQCGPSSLAALRYHLSAANDRISIAIVRERLKNSDWGRLPLFYWYLWSLVPFKIINLVYLLKKRL